MTVPRLFALLVTALALLSCTAHQAERGFFTGRRAEILNLLRQAQQEKVHDQAITLALRAKAESEEEDDPVARYAVNTTLGQIYQQLGDEEAATTHMGIAMEEMSSLVESEEGFVQAYYTVFLANYDTGSLQALLSDATVTAILGDFDTMAEELEEIAAEEDLTPKQRVALTGLKKFIDDFREGAVHSDVRKLKRARSHLSSALSLMAQEARAGDEEDGEAVELVSGFLREILTLYIAGIERHRRAYERAARGVATTMLRLMELEEK